MFRFGYANHKKSFKGGVYENQTELSKYVCGLKHSGVDNEISWEVIKRAQPIVDGNSQYVGCVSKKQQPLYMH